MTLIFTIINRSSPPLLSVVCLFLSYIVVTPLMLGFKDFSCHSHLGPIRIPPLFPSALPFYEKQDRCTIELYYLTACFRQILLLQLVGHRVLQISRVFFSFPMLLLPYQLALSGMDRLNFLLGSLVLTLLCGIHSRSALGFRNGNSSKNPTTSPTSLPPTLSRTSETILFHVLSSIGYSSPFVSILPISVEISSQDKA